MLLPVIVFTIAITLTVVAAGYVHQSAQSRDDARFKSDARDIHNRIEQRLQVQVTALRGLAAHIAANPDLDRAAFFEYVGRISLNEAMVGVEGIGYSAYIPEPLLDDYEDRMAFEGLKDFRYWSDDPSGLPPETHAILYLYPETARNRKAIGFNMYGNPVRREAMRLARDSGNPSASGAVRLVQEGELGEEQGFLIYVPVYQMGANLESDGSRRANFIGFAYSPLRSRDFFTQAIDEVSTEVAFRVLDRDQGGKTLYKSRHFIEPNDPDAEFYEKNKLTKVGENWLIEYQSTAAFDQNSRKGLAYYIFGIGLCVAMLLYVLTHAEVKARKRVHLEMGERKQVQRDLALSEERLRTLVEQAPLSIQVLQPNGITSQVNKGFEQLWGINLDHLLEYNLLDDPQLNEKGVTPYLKRAFAGEPVKIPAIEYETQSTLGYGNTRWVSALAYPLKDEDGSVREVVLIHQDLTDIKRVEDEIRDINSRLEERIEQRTEELARAISEMEAFSYSVAHDLRSPLRAMGGFARILTEDHKEGLNEDAQKLLKRIQENSVKMGLLIDGLLDLARVSRAHIDREPVDISASASDVIDSLQKRNPRPEAKVEVQPGMEVFADPRLMENVLQNLLENAWKFTSNTAEPHIEIGRIPARNEDVIFVRDNGAGFEPEFQNKLFGAFERLHSEAEYPGTGIGLATVRRILERHGGRVWAEGAPGEGATFYFAVPRGPSVGRRKATVAMASASPDRQAPTESG